MLKATLKQLPIFLNISDKSCLLAGSTSARLAERRSYGSDL